MLRLTYLRDFSNEISKIFAPWFNTLRQKGQTLLFPQRSSPSEAAEIPSRKQFPHYLLLTFGLPGQNSSPISTTLSNILNNFTLVLTSTKTGLSEATSKSLEDFYSLDSTYSQPIDSIGLDIIPFNTLYFFALREVGTFRPTSVLTPVFSNQVSSFKSDPLINESVQAKIQSVSE